MNSQNITPSLAVSLSPVIHFSALQLFVWLYSLQLSVMVHFNSYITNTHKANSPTELGNHCVSECSDCRIIMWYM